jgi:hypothetical protein
MRDCVVPPAIETGPNCDLDYVTDKGRELHIEHAIAKPHRLRQQEPRHAPAPGVEMGENMGEETSRVDWNRRDSQ